MIPTFTTEVHGLPFICSDDSAVGRVVKKGEYELAEVRCLQHVLLPGKNFIDCGANVGYFTILAAKLLGPTGRVEAFEPDPDNLEILRANVNNNQFTNVTVHAAAAGLKNGQRFLYQSVGNAGDHRTWNDNKELRPTVAVQVEQLDSVLADLERIDVMKIDVQGDEMQVLQGAQQLINRSPGMVLSIEYWPYGLSTNGSSPSAFADFLYGNNFQVMFIFPQNGVLSHVSRNDLLGLFGHNDDQVCNLWCTKGR